MLPPEMKTYLEDFSRMLREHLGISYNTIITLEVLIEAIKTKFANFEIVYSDVEKLVINKDSTCIIYLQKDKSDDDQLVCVSLFFVYALLNLTSKTINKKIEISMGNILNDKNSYFVTLAFLIPINLFYQLISHHNTSSKTSIDELIDAISNDLKIKKHYVYKRGKDLKYLK